jgi:hypothetical protein
LPFAVTWPFKEECRRALIDDLENIANSVIQQAKGGCTKSQHLVIRYQGKLIGWMPREEHTGADGEAIKVEAVDQEAVAAEHNLPISVRRQLAELRRQQRELIEANSQPDAGGTEN